MSRKTGLTSRQLTDAPAGAGFVWPNERLDYPIKLARYLKRFDLVIYKPEVLDRISTIGRRELVLDHALVPILSRRRQEAHDQHAAWLQNTLPNKDRK